MRKCLLPVNHAPKGRLTFLSVISSFDLDEAAKCKFAGSSTGTGGCLPQLTLWRDRAAGGGLPRPPAIASIGFDYRLASICHVSGSRHHFIIFGTGHFPRGS